MGREAECDSVRLDMEWKLGREAECDSVRLDMEWKLGRMGLVSEPRTPLRALIARESGGSLWADGADLKPASSPGRKRADGKSGSSPVGSLFGARIGHVSHKTRMFKKAQAIAERPMQLGALFAQEAREEEEEEEEESVGAAQVQQQQPLRDLIAAELWGGPVTDGRSPRSRSVDAAKVGESQELRYLFAKDWALQTSDEEDEFWDSGSLCGAAPVLSRSLPRRRSRFYKNEKLSSSPRPVPEIEIVKVQEHRIQSPASLGTLLGEEIATSSGSPLDGPRWSSTPAAESSRRVKIGSLDDISAPVRRESQSQLDSLIAKILTLRANSNNGACSDSRNNGACSDSRNNGACSDSRNNGGCSDSRNNGGCSDSRNNGGCSDSGNNGGCSDSGKHGGCSAASGSMRTPADVTVGEELKETDSAPATDVNISISEAPNILLEEIKEPTPSEAPTASSTGVETPVTEAAEPLRDGGQEEASTSPDREGVKDQPRVPLGTLLERTWGEHGWLPLGRSQMGSPLPALSRSRSHCEEDPPGPSPEAEAVEVPPAEVEPVEAPEPTTVAAAEASVLAAEASVEAAEAGVEATEASLEAVEASVEAAVASVEAAEASVEAAEASVEAAEASVEAAEASVEAAVASVEAAEASAEAAESRPPTRVSLLSLLNQDMETDEEGLQADVRGRRDEEEDEVVTEELDPMCCVCMVGHKGAAFIPCGHTFCRKCCREVRRSIGSCPLCNQTIVDVLKLY